MPVEARTVTGYHQGKPFPLIVVRCGNVWLEASTALRFDLMASDADDAGIELAATSGFRTMSEQRKTFDDRRCVCLRKHNSTCPIVVKGPVARPGYSNHQTGIAVDIHTGLSCVDLKAGKSTPIFDWLTRNAKAYGFERTVSAEPWHWEARPQIERREV